MGKAWIVEQEKKQLLKKITFLINVYNSEHLKEQVTNIFIEDKPYEDNEKVSISNIVLVYT